MKILFSTGSLWSYSLERCFELAAEAGYDGLELMIDQRWESRQADYLRRLVDRFRLPILAVHSPFWPAVPGWPDDQPGRITLSLRLAEQFGAGVVVHHLPARVAHWLVMAGSRLFAVPVPGRNPETGYRRWLETAYPTLQAQTSVKLCIENMPAYHRLGRRWNLHHWNRPEQIIRFPHLTLDTTHLGTWGLEPLTIYPQLKGQVSHIHLSNYNGREHRLPDDGRLGLDRLLNHLADSHYPGTISLELYPETLQAGQSDSRVLEQMALALDYCRRASHFKE